MSGAVRSRVLVGAFLLVLTLISTACGGGGREDQGGESSAGDAGGAPSSIAVEGSNIVRPITQAAAEAFEQEKQDAPQISVGGSDTGDDFEALCNGEAQIFDASRPMEEAEARTCQENGTEFIELPVALDALSIVVNPQNDFAKDITLDELRMLWEPSAEGRVTTWRQIRSEWPDRQINLYGPGREKGNFEFFTARAVGRASESRSDYQVSEDDNALAQSVATDPNALGYLGFSYFEENQQRIKALAVEGVAPGVDTINSSQYPLSRPLFVYVSRQALDKNPSLREFVNFYLDNLNQFVEQAQYVPLPSQVAQETRERFDNLITGIAPESTAKGEKGKEDTT